MKQLRYTLSFTTPAFMGNAEQNAQWRTPPIKALLRQWWRVAYAVDHQFQVNVPTMRREEGLLFGNAWLSHKEGQKDVNDHCKSQVRIRLAMPDGQNGNAWGMGTQQGVAPLTTGLDTGYAWFGLVNRGSGTPDRNAIAIKANESRRDLLLAVPDDHAERIQTTLQLIHAFGQLGSRSRGGWGSFALTGIEPLQINVLNSRFSQALDDCLNHDWPISLCKDNTGLCLWESKSTFPSWDKAMRMVAQERKNARVALKSFKGRDLRPVLGFATPGRMPSPLRWRVVPAASGQLAVSVFAMPTLIPEEGKQRIDKAQTKDSWHEVFRVMDASAHFNPRGNRS